jgi:hypothetical protein
MSIRSHPGSRAVLSLALVAIVAAACSGGGSSTPAVAAAASSSAESAAPAASAGDSAPASAQPAGGASQSAPASAGAAGGAGQPVTVCDLLPVATVASITGQSLNQATESDTPALQSYGCYYGGAGTAGVTVTVAYDAAGTFDTLMQAALALGGEQVSGLGDKAYHAVLGVNALFGNVGIFASTDPAATALEPDDAAITLIKTLQPKL